MKLSGFRVLLGDQFSGSGRGRGFKNRVFSPRVSGFRVPDYITIWRPAICYNNNKKAIVFGAKNAFWHFWNVQKMIFGSYRNVKKGVLQSDLTTGSEFFPYFFDLPQKNFKASCFDFILRAAARFWPIIWPIVWK